MKSGEKSLEKELEHVVVVLVSELSWFHKAQSHNEILRRLLWGGCY